MDKTKLFIACIFVAGLQLCSARAIFKYIPFTPFSFFLILLICTPVYYLLLKALTSTGKMWNWLKSPFITALLVAIITIANIFIYPKADALKHSGQGSDADDAIVMATTKLFKGEYPYSERTYLGNSISPGPGILLAYAPFVLTGSYFLAIPFFVCLLLWAIRSFSRNDKAVNVGLLLLMSSLGFWEYMFIGSDLFSIGCLLVLLLLLAMRYYERSALLVVVAVAAGILLTSRIHLAYLAPVIAFIIYTRKKNSGILFGLIALLTCIALHLLFYFWQPGQYAPMHLLSKGQRSMGLPLLIPVAGISMFLFISFIRIRLFDQILSLKYFWLFIALPHLFIGIARLVSDGFRLNISEGPGYMVIQIAPLMIFCLLYVTVNARRVRPFEKEGPELIKKTMAF